MNDYFQAQIHNLERYRQQIRKLFSKLKERRALFTTQQAGVNYFSFGLHENTLAKLLRQAVCDETYQFGSARQRSITVNHKKRVVYDFLLTDKIVISVVMSILLELAEHFLANQVFSYRKGRRPLTAVKKFSRFLQTLPKTGARVNADCYVLKTDVADYTDNIRLDEHSKLWQLLDLMLAQAGCHLTAYQQGLLRYCFRPEYLNPEGLLQSNIKGVPTGSIASTLAYNLYMAEIDKAMLKISGLYYSRYSDDILIAHPLPENLTAAVSHFTQMLTRLGLQRKLAKDQALYLTHAGRPHADANWQGVHKLTYLGYDVYAQGNFSLSAKRQAKLLTAVRQRIANVLTLSQGRLTQDELGKTLCQALNNALADEIFGEQAVSALLECTHLGILKHLDYLFALFIAEALTHIKGAKAFRIVSYQRIRRVWGLNSLLKRQIQQWQRNHEKNKPLV